MPETLGSVCDSLLEPGSIDSWMPGATMGAALDIYRLYRWRHDHRERLVLAKATRPEFPNWSQPAEDATVAEVDARFAAVLTSYGAGLPAGHTEVIATWEGGYPD